MLTKKKSLSLPETWLLKLLAIVNSVLNKGEPVIPPLLPSASNKANLFVESVCKNSNLDESGITSRTNLKLHNIPVSIQLVKKVIGSWL